MVDDLEDLALLEARDLLFARLLQYRAYKQAAALFAELEASALQRYPRAVSLEDHFAQLLPEVTLGVDPMGFAEVAAAALTPKTDSHGRPGPPSTSRRCRFQSRPSGCRRCCATRRTVA